MYLPTYGTSLVAQAGKESSYNAGGTIPWRKDRLPSILGLPWGSDYKESSHDVGDLGLIPGWEDPLEEGMATHLSSFAWRIPWTEESDRLQSTGSQRVGHDWSDLARTLPTYIFNLPFLLIYLTLI